MNYLSSLFLWLVASKLEVSFTNSIFLLIYVWKKEKLQYPPILITETFLPLSFSSFLVKSLEKHPSFPFYMFGRTSNWDLWENQLHIRSLRRYSCILGDECQPTWCSKAHILLRWHIERRASIQNPRQSILLTLFTLIKFIFSFFFWLFVIIMCYRILLNYIFPKKIT